MTKVLRWHCSSCSGWVAEAPGIPTVWVLSIVLSAILDAPKVTVTQSSRQRLRKRQSSRRSLLFFESLLKTLSQKYPRGLPKLE